MTYHDPLEAFLANGCRRLDFLKSYRGMYDSERAFGEMLANELYYLKLSPDSLSEYFDYDKFSRDIFRNDYFSQPAPDGRVYVFLNI